MNSEKEFFNGLNQNLFNALHDLGVVATQDEMNMVLAAVEKDKQDAFRIKVKASVQGFSGDLLDKLFP